MRFRRGFKKEADDYARELREELRLEPHAPLCPWRLAEHLLIPVIPMTSLPGVGSGTLGYFRGTGRTVFSAATVFRRTRRAIVHNDTHHPSRQASNIAHELAHGILGHPPRPPLSDSGCRNFDPDLEAEADWLGTALLVSQEAAIHIAFRALSLDRASEEYGVSRPVIQMRLNVTGARRIVERTRSRRSRRRR